MSDKISSLWGNLSKKNKPWHENVTDMWAKTPFFLGIPKSEIRNLSKNMHLRRYQNGETIFHLGDQGAGAAMIISGRVEIRYQNAVLATLKKGDFFGEIALALNERRTADAIATEDCELVFFLRLDYEEWISRKPLHGAKLSTNLAHVLAQRLLHANQMLSEQREK